MAPYVYSRDGSECQISKTLLRIVRCVLLRLIQIRMSPKRGKCTWNSNLWTKCRTERRSHAFKFSDGYKSTMDWCSVYLAPQGLPKYIYLSPPLIFPTTYNGIRTKNHPVWITSGTAPIRWMGPIHIPRWEQKRTEGYVIVSRPACVSNGSVLHYREGKSACLSLNPLPFLHIQPHFEKWL
jgi:hypothetical protein